MEAIFGYGTGHGSSHGFFPQFEPVRVMNYSVEEWTLTVVKKFIRGGMSVRNTFWTFSYKNSI